MNIGKTHQPPYSQITSDRRWDALLKYANLKRRPDEKSAVWAAKLAKSLEETLFFCGTTRVACSDVDAMRPGADGRLQRLAVKHQSELQEVLTWYASPERHHSLTKNVADFLNKYAQRKQQRFRPVLDTSDPSGFFYAIGAHVKYDSVLSPVALFLLEQMEPLGWQGSQLRPPPMLCRCQRRECGKFLLAKRPRRARYCSNLCCVQDHRRNVSPAEHRDYVWLLRLEHLEKDPAKSGVLKGKLHQPETVDRLKRIAEEYPKLAERAEKLLSGNRDKTPS